MKKGSYKITLGLALAAAVIALLVAFFRPRPIVSGEDSQILFVWHIIDREIIHIEDYDEEKILSYLETCYEQRNLFQRQTGSLVSENVVLMIQLHTNGHLKLIYLGRNNYSDEGTGTVKWSVHNADEIRAAICTMLGL